MAASKNLTTEQRKERARKASAAAHSNERYVKAIIDRGPTLSTEQWSRIELAMTGGAK